MPARSCTREELEQFPQLEWDQVAPKLQPDIRATIEQVLDKQDSAAIPREQWFPLAYAQGEDLLGLVVAANALRSELVGNLITYVVNRNINFTNVCFIGCKFCAFSRGPRQEDIYFYTPEEIARKAVDAAQIGATEVCIQGGLPRGLDPYYYRDVLRAVKAAMPSMHIHAFSPMEIIYGVELTGMPLRDYLTMLLTLDHGASNMLVA